MSTLRYIIKTTSGHHVKDESADAIDYATPELAHAALNVMAERGSLDDDEYVVVGKVNS